MVSDSRQTVFDAHVRPDPAHLLDTNYRFSGVKAEDLLEPNAKYTLSEVQRKLGELIGPQTILLGHGKQSFFCSAAFYPDNRPCSQALKTISKHCASYILWRVSSTHQ